ncbi:MAG TPA: hypothetical protein DCL41_07585 [Bdellovibrionales bacterium]|nr:hypothetical protein [Bdellovibrionales bacterium]
MHAVRLISENGSFITSENLITIGGIAGGGALLLKYGRSLSPAGAFLLGLGLSPVAASEYCDMYSGSDGIERFLALSADLQLREASYCPKLAGEIIKMGKEVSDLNK